MKTAVLVGGAVLDGILIGSILGFGLITLYVMFVGKPLLDAVTGF